MVIFWFLVSRNRNDVHCPTPMYKIAVSIIFESIHMSNIIYHCSQIIFTSPTS